MTKSNNSLLTTEEKAICEQVSKSNNVPHNQRAQVLLALNNGLTQIKASQEVGLTIGQIRYCLHRFRQLRTGIFQTVTQQQITQEKPEVASEPASGELDKVKDKKKKDKKADKKSNKKRKAEKDSDKNKKTKKQKRNKAGKAKDKKKKDKKSNKKSSKKKGTKKHKK